MELENLISKMRKFKQAVIAEGRQDLKMVYCIPSVHTCLFPTFTDNGYYKRHNGEYCVCTKENADFRSIICNNCHTEFFLMNTGVYIWDIIPSPSNENQKKPLMKCK